MKNILIIQKVFKGILCYQCRLYEVFTSTLNRILAAWKSGSQQSLKTFKETMQAESIYLCDFEAPLWAISITSAELTLCLAVSSMLLPSALPEDSLGWDESAHS